MSTNSEKVQTVATILKVVGGILLGVGVLIKIFEKKGT